MFNFFQRLCLLGACASTLAIGGCQNAGADVGRAPGADLVFGGAGSEEGRFAIVRDITFDAENNLYVLESNGQVRISKDDSISGQARVQKFDQSGGFLLQFPLGEDVPAPVRGGGPTRIAVDSRGTIAVTLPQQNVLRLFDARGQKVRDISIPGAQAVTVTSTSKGERFAVIAAKSEAVQLVEARTGAVTSLLLSDAVTNASDIAATPDGALWILNTSQITGFDQNGQKIRALGSGLKKRAEDGSEPQSSLATDSKGNLYAPNGGNPVLIARYKADGSEITMRRGQFKFADSWGNGPSLPLAIDHSDRLWLVSTAYHDPKIAPRFHFAPAVIRTESTFFSSGAGVKTTDARASGLAATIQTNAPNNIFYDLSPVSSEFVLAPSNRLTNNLNVRWNVFDDEQKSVGQGQFDLPNQNGREARAPMNWTPPRFGWYSACAQIFDGQTPLKSVVAHFGVTPRFPGLVALSEGDSSGGWDDAPRQLFAGLPMMRLHVPSRTDDATLDKWMANFEKNKLLQGQGLNIIVQLTDSKANFNVEHLRPALERLRGKVRFIELFNEPNFAFKPAQFVAAAKPIHALIKAIDPNFRVLGPSVCGISLGWHSAFWQAGGGEIYDEFAVHDYEGNESITPEHWRWKFAQLHALMKRFGVDNRPIWQSERAITAVRSGSFLPLTQAVRVSLHMDVLQSLGVPPERNLHYYLNKGGYSKVPSYLWAPEGPFAGALALRTRYALTRGLSYAGQMKFGATGDQLLMGLRFQNPDHRQDALVSLRNLGDLQLNVPFQVSGSPGLQLVDSWGNISRASAQNGRITLSIGQLPTFVRLSPGQSLRAVPLDLGRNMAREAQLQLVQGQTSGVRSLDLLVNGQIEAEHLDSPTKGQTWNGGQLSDGKPAILELRWPTVRPISSVLLRGPRADNSSCALLDFDLQAFQNGAWKTVFQSRTPLPQSYEGQMDDANSVQWYRDDNLRLARFAPVSTDRLRIVALRATYGYNADLSGQTLNRALIKSPPASFFALKEVEVFGP